MLKINEITYDKFYQFYEENKDISVSQIKQDMFVLFVTQKKQNGFFVEFGACDGKELSNTYLLEKNFNWTGILAEPCKYWHEDLLRQRNCIIDKRAVWVISNQNLLFNQVDELKTLSGIENNYFFHNFNRERTNTRNQKYEVLTVSLLDLLKESNAPNDIDYLSIDTEGTEYEIINSFNFNLYNIKIITIEHHFDGDFREKINRTLNSFGYTRVLPDDSNQDDWYVKE